MPAIAPAPRFSRRALLLLLALAALAPAPEAQAGRVPSRAEEAADQAETQDLRHPAARPAVQAALAAHGLSPLEVEERLARLSTEDLQFLAAHTDQIQAAGAVPEYIWILLGILLAVTILATVF